MKNTSWDGGSTISDNRARFNYNNLILYQMKVALTIWLMRVNPSNTDFIIYGKREGDIIKV